MQNQHLETGDSTYTHSFSLSTSKAKYAYVQSRYRQGVYEPISRKQETKKKRRKSKCLISKSNPFGYPILASECISLKKLKKSISLNSHLIPKHTAKRAVKRPCHSYTDPGLVQKLKESQRKETDKGKHQPTKTEAPKLLDGYEEYARSDETSSKQDDSQSNFSRLYTLNTTSSYKKIKKKTSLTVYADNANKCTGDAHNQLGRSQSEASSVQPNNRNNQLDEQSGINDTKQCRVCSDLANLGKLISNKFYIHSYLMQKHIKTILYGYFLI